MTWCFIDWERRRPSASKERESGIIVSLSLNDRPVHIEELIGRVNTGAGDDVVMVGGMVG